MSFLQSDLGSSDPNKLNADSCKALHSSLTSFLKTYCRCLTIYNSIFVLMLHGGAIKFELKMCCLNTTKKRFNRPKVL